MSVENNNCRDEQVLSQDEKLNQAPTFQINEKGLNNSYLEEHVFPKGIGADLMRQCLEKGVEITDEIKHPREGSRYFKLVDSRGLPGRIILPDLNGPLGGRMANWNQSCVYKFRHGKLAPIIKRENLPDWIKQHNSTLYVIIEKNRGSNGRLQIPDGPTEEDEGGDWIVSTAHFGEPSRQKPRIPKDCSNGKAVKKYLESLDTFNREQSRIVFVDLEAEQDDQCTFEDALDVMRVQLADSIKTEK